MSQDYALTLHNSIKRGGAPLWDVTETLRPTWRRSIRAKGGYWLGTSDDQSLLADPRHGWTRDEMMEMFLEGLAREIKETVGGLITWQGLAASIDLTLDGVTYTRSIINVYNATKTIYTRLFDNLLTNGGAESGAWTVINGATVTQATDWVNEGTYSGKVVVADTTVRGALIGAITVVAGRTYNIEGKLNIVSGAWRVSAQRSDTGASLASEGTYLVVGEYRIRFSIPIGNTYSGTVNIKLLSDSVAGSVYGDGFTARHEPLPGVQTGWYTDSGSMSEFGRIELAALMVGSTAAAAIARAKTLLVQSAWPRTHSPNDLSTFDMSLAQGQPDHLSILWHGYSQTLANKYCLAAGSTATMSAHISTLIAQSEFVTAGKIETNSTDFLVDDRAPIRAWQAINDIIDAGDDTGQKWIGGVYGGRLFDYQPAPGTIAYHYRQGRYYDASGGELEPYFVVPGYNLQLDDAPVGPTQISGHDEDDPRIQFVAEVEMGPATPEFPMGTLVMRHTIT